MRIEKVKLVYRKDWQEIRRSRQVLLPIIFVPFIFSVLLPLILIIIPKQSTNLQGLGPWLTLMPDFVRREIEGLNVTLEAEYLILVYLFSPFFLIIPTLTSSVIASDSFAGEKERKTIEALLATPIADDELFLGKMLVSFIPSMMVTVLCFMGYSVIVDLTTFEASGRLLLPNVTWILLIFLLAPTFALASIGLTVMISVRVKGYREAQQISAVLLLPVLGLLFAQMSGAVFFGPIAILSLTGIMVVLDIVIFRLGVKLFRREQILQRLA